MKRPWITLAIVALAISTALLAIAQKSHPSRLLPPPRSRGLWTARSAPSPACWTVGTATQRMTGSAFGTWTSPVTRSHSRFSQI